MRLTLTVFIKRNIFFIIFLSIFAYSIPLAHSSPLTAFFFDAKASSVDADGDGGDDYIIVRFDVDLDEEITSSVTVLATLHDKTGKIVSSTEISYSVTGQEAGYASLILTPIPDIEGEYYIHLVLSDLSDELYIDNIYYDPKLGSKPTAYFAHVVKLSELDGIKLEFDINMIQQIEWNVRLDADLLDSSGVTIASETLYYMTSFEDMDYKQLMFTPPYADAYSTTLIVYPEGSLVATDSRIVQIMWPPGTGAYFRGYEALAFGDHIELTFDVDLAYNITYDVLVEAVLYDSNSDIVGYNYTNYLTNGESEDRKTLSLIPEPALPGEYYVEFIVYTDGYPSSYGYIEQILFGRPRWDINGDNSIDIMDLSLLCMSFGKKAASLENPNADINRDGIVNILDIIILSAHLSVIGSE